MLLLEWTDNSVSSSGVSSSGMSRSVKVGEDGAVSRTVSSMHVGWHQACHQHVGQHKVSHHSPVQRTLSGVSPSRLGPSPACKTASAPLPAPYHKMVVCITWRPWHYKGHFICFSVGKLGILAVAIAVSTGRTRRVEPTLSNILHYLYLQIYYSSFVDDGLSGTVCAGEGPVKSRALEEMPSAWPSVPADWEHLGRGQSGAPSKGLKDTL